MNLSNLLPYGRITLLFTCLMLWGRLQANAPTKIPLRLTIDGKPSSFDQTLVAKRHVKVSFSEVPASGGEIEVENSDGIRMAAFQFTPNGKGDASVDFSVKRWPEGLYHLSIRVGNQFDQVNLFISEEHK
ncbi:hypothetical protein [Pontibacter sp. G13]|uniref:hypothetical protein n=1 Tax=Pontibacter sp. G13 TaxID=3074898 RepID=UPI0028895D71|nr:hypothetical protein [Pontibacter sp. G13]WNJ18199.1 hypothetical protein RJD25_25390 [Pontibacter sp. G13]